MFNKILADHDDVYSHGTILYQFHDEPYAVYEDKACNNQVEGETLKDIYLKGCVVAVVDDNGEVTGYYKPTSLSVGIWPNGSYYYVLDGNVGGGSSGGGQLYSQNIALRLYRSDSCYAIVDIQMITTKSEPLSWEDFVNMTNKQAFYSIRSGSSIYLDPEAGDNPELAYRVDGIESAGHYVRVQYWKGYSLADRFFEQFNTDTGDEIEMTVTSIVAI